MHEREHERRLRDAITTTDDHATPGRASTTAGLTPRSRPESSGILMRKAERDDNNVRADASTFVDRASASSGSELPSGLRTQFEASLDTDLSSVRIHTGTESQEAANAVGARAYTVGHNIYFGANQFDPSSSAGQHLIAHEVAHTAQQRGGSPTRQNKLEVSTSADSAELEADRAADAMLAGQRAMVTPNSSLARKVLRDEAEEEMPEVKSLQEHIEQDPSARAVDRDTAYNYQDVHDEKGNVRSKDPVVANAQKNGALSALQRLSEEMTMAKPLMMSWIESAAAATAIAKATHLNIGTPEAYRPVVKKMGDEINSGSEKGKELGALAAAQNKISAASVKAAGAGIKEAISKVAGARARLASHQAKLEQKVKQKELQEKKDELAKVQAEIKLVADLLKETTALVTSLSKASSVFNMMSVTAKSYEKGYNEITGTKDTTEAILQWAFYEPKIKAINGKMAGLNKQIQGLSVSIDSFDTSGFQSELNGAKASFEKSTLEMANEKQAYLAKMQQLGRRYDQKSLKPGERALFPGASPGEGETVSMEGILALSAALQGRGASREAFASMVEQCPNLQNAPKIVDDALGGGAGVWVDDGFGNKEHKWLPQDHPYMNPSDDLVAKASELRTTCGNFTAAIRHLKDGAAADVAVESAWQAMIQSATGGAGSQIR